MEGKEKVVDVQQLKAMVDRLTSDLSTAIDSLRRFSSELDQLVEE
jgi:hypothetical protein